MSPPAARASHSICGTPDQNIFNPVGAGGSVSILPAGRLPPELLFPLLRFSEERPHAH